MVRMFLGTQILFAMSHTKGGLLSNDPSDKSLALGGRAKVGGGGELKMKWTGDKQWQAIINYFSSNSLKIIKPFSLPFYLISFPFSPNTSKNEPQFSEKESRKDKIPSSFGRLEIPAIPWLCLVSLKKITSDLTCCCGFGDKLNLFFLESRKCHSYFFYLEIIDSVDGGAKKRPYGTSNPFNFPG